MSEWKEYRLGDILSIKSGFSYKGKYIGTGKSLLLGMGCVSFREKFLMSGARPYSGPYDERYKVYPGDIVLATRQQSDNLPILAMPAMVPYSLEGKDIVIGTNLYKVEITDKSFPNDYIYWLLKTKRYINYIAGVKTGTTVSMVTKKNVEDFTFIAPINPEERIEIASVMASLDDKIAINRRICENLEAQAQALFKHWFIDFAPFKDGKFVESELGMIPEGWREGTLGEITEVSSGKRPNNRYDSETEDHKVPLIGASCVMGYTSDVFTSSKILLTGRVGTLGVVQRFNSDCWPSDNTLVLTTPYYEFVYQILKTLNYSGMNRGTSQPLITQGDLKKTPIIIPPEACIFEFENIASELMSHLEHSKTESNKLSTLRDTLLPKLMSGQIKL